jgi:hypothetical protein
MKKVLYILGVLAITIATQSCSKTYTCTTTSEVAGMSSSASVDVKMTSSEKNDYEEAGTSSVSAGGITTAVVTTCD